MCPVSGQDVEQIKGFSVSSQRVEQLLHQVRLSNNFKGLSPLTYHIRRLSPQVLELHFVGWFA